MTNDKSLLSHTTVQVQEANEANSPDEDCVVPVASPQTVLLRQSRDYSVWIRIAIYTFFVLSGQAAAALLGRLYFAKGGNSLWMATLLQIGGFPILLPFYLIPPPKNPNTASTNIIHTEREQPPLSILITIYVSLGLLVAAYCFFYSVALMNLPVSTYSLILTSQLAFNSFFSFFLNSQKFTPFIINSLVLLTISSTLLAFQKESSSVSTQLSVGKYAIGFICALGASAGYGLVLSLRQFAFEKVIKKETFTVIMDMVIYPSLVASCVVVVGLFASKEWMGIKREMEEYELGKVSYVMTLVWSAITMQVFTIGAVGLVLETSSLFSNAISVLGLPIVPVLAVIFFHDTMGGIKVISMILAIWGFVSYAYQQYLDDCKSKTDKEEAGVSSQS